MSGKDSWGRRFADFKGQNKVDGNKYGSQPIINVFSKYRCLSASFRCAVFVVMTVRWLTMKAN